MRTVLQDLRYSFRQLVKTPGFALTAVISIALGIGATTAVFSVVYAILMDPFPYANSDRMVHMRLMSPKGDSEGFGLTGTQFQVIRKASVVEDAFLTNEWNLTVTGSDLPEDVRGAYVSSNTFNFLGVPPILGRGIQPSDAIDGQDPQPVVVLAYNFWQRHYHGDPSVVGKTIQLLRKNYTIIGVAAPRFTWNDGDVYLPQKITTDQTLGYYVGLRLKPGVTHAQADAALQPLIVQFAKDTPKHFPIGNIRLHVVGLNEQFVKDLGGTLYLLFGAVALLLLIGCGNVSILLLARASARQHEFAVRSAIGASRRRIVRQLLTESVLISLTGAGLGIALAYKSLDFIVANLPEYSFPHEAAIRINLPVLLFSIAIAVGTGILFGLWPALQLAHVDANRALQSGTRKVAGSVRGRRIHNALIAGQIALTLLMMTGAGAAIKGFVRLMHIPLGYDPHNVMSVGIPIHDGTYKAWAERAAYFERLRADIATVPGVTMTATSSNATPPSNGFTTKFDIVGRAHVDDQSARFNLVSPEYFSILRIPLMAGRVWNRAENHRGAALMVINQTMARRYFPAGDAIGRMVKAPEVISRPPYLLVSPEAQNGFLIIGIVADKLDDGLSKPILPECFLPNTAAMGMYTQILVRSEVSPLTLLHSVRVKVNHIDPDQQTIGDIRDLEHWIMQEPEWARGRLISWLFTAFAGLALLLAAVGLFSVVSYTVAQRTNEFGIRLALGAQRSHVLGIVFRSTLTSVCAGIAGGLLLAVTLSQLMAHWDADSASSRDPLILLGATFVLAFVAALACAFPAGRAAVANPMNAIRYE